MGKGADRVKELIEEAKAAGLTKSKIARAIGITPQHLSNLLSGKNQWRITQLEAVCRVLEISLAEMFFEQGEDVELFILLRKILDAGPEPYRIIAWNLHGMARQIEFAGPRLDHRFEPKFTVTKKKLSR